MSFELSRREYTDLYGPTTGDLVRLGDTELFAEVEAVVLDDAVEPAAAPSASVVKAAPAEDDEDEDVDPETIKVTEGAEDEEGFEWVPRKAARARSIAGSSAGRSLSSGTSSGSIGRT